MINATIIGHLGRDPETKAYGDGKELVRFSVACKTGKDKTTWVNVTAFGRHERVLRYFSKGDGIVISGQLELREYTAKDGDKRSSLDMTAEQIAFPPRGPERHEKPERTRDAYEPAPEDEDDGIPF